VVLVFEEGEVSKMEEVDDDVDGRMVLEVVVVVVVVVFGLSSPPLLLVVFLVVWLDCIDTTEGLTV